MSEQEGDPQGEPNPADIGPPEAPADGQGESPVEAESRRRETALPGWQREMPEDLRARLEDLSPEAQKFIRDNAEKGLRLSDYSRKMNALPRREQFEAAVQKAELLDKLVTSRPELFGAAPQQQNGNGHAAAPADEVRLAEELLETTDPKEFASKLGAILQSQKDRILGEVQQTLASSPDAKVSRLDAAAAEIRRSYGERLTDEGWKSAVASFKERVSRFGGDWRTIDPSHLAFLMEPELERQVQDPVSFSRQQPEAPRSRQASIVNGQPAVGTKRKPVWEREGRLPTDDEVFQQTLAQFPGLTPDGLDKLRSMEVGLP